MEQLRPSYLEQIPQEDWQKTPPSVKKLMEEMAQRVENLEKQLTDVLADQQHLLEKTKRTSKNSSSPPSTDPPGFGTKQQNNKSNKKRGGQREHVTFAKWSDGNQAIEISTTMG